MTRRLRIQYPGTMYHVRSRGDRREAIFADDVDRQRLLETRTEACQKTGWQVPAYCLMRNHFHWVIETPQPTLPAGMEWRRREDWRAGFKRVERGWCLGGEQFRQELLEQVETRPGPSHCGEAVQEAETVQAERLGVEGLKRMRRSEADLRARRKREPGKFDLAWELRSKTTTPLTRIAERLGMGCRGHLAWLLQQRHKCWRAAPSDQCLLGICQSHPFSVHQRRGSGRVASPSPPSNRNAWCRDVISILHLSDERKE